MFYVFVNVIFHETTSTTNVSWTCRERVCFHSFQPPIVWSVQASCDVVDACRIPSEPPTAESLLDTFTAEERVALAAIPATSNADDLLLLAQLHKKGNYSLTLR